MREPTDTHKLDRLIAIIGQKARGPGKVYFVGGTTAVALGIRPSTKDADLKLDPEPPGVFEALQEVKEELHMNVELASPDHFIPPVPGWRERSVFIRRSGAVDFYHYDPMGQALSKIERGHAQDLDDVRALAERDLVDAAQLRRAIAAVEPELLRYPAVDPAGFAQRVEAMARELEANG